MPQKQLLVNKVLKQLNKHRWGLLIYQRANQLLTGKVSTLSTISWAMTLAQMPRKLALAPG